MLSLPVFITVFVWFVISFRLSVMYCAVISTIMLIKAISSISSVLVCPFESCISFGLLGFVLFAVHRRVPRTFVCLKNSWSILSVPLVL